jgi:hypothetical protein
MTPDAQLALPLQDARAAVGRASAENTETARQRAESARHEAFDPTPLPADPAAEEMRLVAANPDRFAPDFADWLADNRHVWREFVRQADAVARRGYEHYSARTVIEVIRHHTKLAEVSADGWKVNNNHVPDIARLYALVRPHRAEFFEFRVQAGKSKRAA